MMDRRLPAPAKGSVFDIEALVGSILFSGVLLSVTFLAAGLIWRWKNTGAPVLDYSIGGANLLQFWKDTFAQAWAGDFRPRLLINLGLGLLLATPYLRVAVSMLYFACVERNIKYTFCTAFVLAGLTYTLLLR